MGEASHDEVYAGMLRELLAPDAERVATRNSTVTRLIARQYTFRSTPLVTLRRVAWKNCLREMEFFLAGGDNVRDLHQSVRPWWEPWADKNGYMPNSYGRQFRAFYGQNSRADQVKLLVDGVRDHPHSRRNLITTWNTADMVHTSTLITTCHGTIIHAFVRQDSSLDLVTYQRSVDVVVGLPHNLLQYWALLLWLAAQTGRTVGALTWIGGDVHLYDVHRGLAQRIVDTVPQTPCPQLVYRSGNEDFLADDFDLDAEYRPAINERAEMVV